MAEIAVPTAPPAQLLVLRKGRHRDPSHGACFMEYTSLLAGEPFSDAPRCVDPELAAILRAANDTLPDQRRPVLVPLLGRAIGLVIEQPAGARPRPWDLHIRRADRAEADRAVALTVRLHALVTEKFLAAAGVPTSRAWSRWYRHYATVSEMFWDLMSEPARARTFDDYGARLVQRLDLLHRCYEEVLTELGVRAPEVTAPAPAPAPAPVPEPRRAPSADVLVGAG